MSIETLIYRLSATEQEAFRPLPNFSKHPPTFLWVCRTTAQKEICICVIDSSGIFVFAQNVPSWSIQLRFEDATIEWSVAISAVTDGTVLLDCFGNLAASQHRGLLLTFPTRDIAMTAVQHIEFHSAKFCQTKRYVHPHPITTDQVLTHHLELGAASVDESVTESDRRGKKKTVALFGGDADHFHVANQKQFCSAAVSLWSEWRKGLSQVLSETSRCGPLAKVLLSTDAQLKSKTHEIVVVTDRTFLIAKRRDPSIVRVMIPIHAIEQVYFHSITEKSGALDILASTLSGSQSSATVGWDVLIQYDLKYPFTRGVVADVSFTMTTRNKEIFLSALARQYEELTARRLPSSRVENVFWKRRTFVQVNVMRAANKVLRRMEASSTLTEAAQQRIAQDCQTLLTRHTLDFVVAFVSESSGDSDALGFGARCLLWASRFVNMECESISSCIAFELHRVATGTQNRFNGGFGITDSRAGFLRSRGQVDYVLKESGVNSGGQYLRVLLSQCFEELVHAGKVGLMGPSEVLRWSTQVLTPLMTTDNETITNLFPMNIRELLTIIVELVSDDDGTVDLDGYRFARDFLASFFIGSCVTSPQEYGLVTTELEGTQSLNLNVISRVIQRIANGCTSASAPHSNWFHAHASDAKADEAALQVIRATDPAVLEELSASFQHYTDKLLLKGERRQRIKRAVAAVLLRNPCGTVQRDVPAVSLLRWQVFYELLQGQTANIMIKALENCDHSNSPLREDRSTSQRLQQLMKRRKSGGDDPISNMNRDRVLQSSEIAEVNEKLEAARSVERKLSTQLSAAIDKQHQLQVEIDVREGELASLRRKLRDHDLHSLPHEASQISMMPPVPMMEGQSLFLSPTTGMRRGPRWYSDSASVFGCPLDSYDLAFSPSEMKEL